jgi:hypothetical protein
MAETQFARSRHLRYMPPVEGDLSTRRHWVIVREPGCVPQKKGPFPFDQLDGFLQELVDCRCADTDLTVVSLTWDFDVWVQDGRERLSIHALPPEPPEDNSNG